MTSCPICKFQIVDESMGVCPNCGTPIQTKVSPDGGSGEGLANESTEGLEKADYTSTVSKSEDALEICDPGEFLCNHMEEPPKVEPSEIPLGRSDPHPPEAIDDFETGDAASATAPIGKLSDEQVASIRSGLLNGEEEDYVSAFDASSIVHNISKDDQSLKAEGTALPPSTPPPPANKIPAALKKQEAAVVDHFGQSPPVRRIAFYHKNFIQLTGSYSPATGDELNIGDHYYLLKPKKIKGPYAIAAFALVLVVLLYFVGRQFISPTMPGKGTLIGIILDQQERPYVHGMEIVLPETGHKTKSDPTGFFRFEKIPPGVYTVRFRLSDGTPVSENVSVTSDALTTIILGGQILTQPLPDSYSPQETEASYRGQKSESSEAKSTGDVPSSPASPRYASLRLRSNADNPRVKVNNNIIGSGNLTFKNLDPGTHPVEISQSGYQTWKGTVRLKGGETYTLQVALEKIRTAQTSSPAAETPQYTAEDFYQSGLTMLSAGKAAEAIKDLNQAIDMKPSLADAYRARAEACLATGNNNAAHDDYIRAGEINFSQKRLESALSLFNKALAINNKSMAALLNIGDCYNEQNDHNEALRYYKNVLTIDDNNFKANFEIGKIYFALGKNRDADKKLRLARELNPSVPEVYHYLMLNHLARDDIKNVEKAYADFQLNASPKAVEDFKSDRRFDALHRIVGEYERP